MTKSSPIGIVTGLQMEAEIARTLPHAEVMCLGPGPLKATQAAQVLIDRGVCALVSFGIAGGLDLSLASGDIVASPNIAHAQGYRLHEITTVTAPVLTPKDKAALHAKTGADAVDMESSAIEDAAKAAGLPYLFIRAICDEAGDEIPQLALKGMSPDGTTRPVRVALGLATRPQDLRGLIHLGNQQKKALAALRDFAALQLDLTTLL